MLVQKYRDLEHPVYMCFIDFEKAFDKVNHKMLIDVLKTSNIQDKDLQIIKNLCWNQRANIMVGNSLSKDVSIEKGVRQGCILSPLLFNFYSEHVFRKTLESTVEEIKIDDETVNNIRYADDTVLLASNPSDLQLLIDNIVNSCKKYGLKLNTTKTNYMIVHKKPQPRPNITAYREILEK